MKYTFHTASFPTIPAASFAIRSLFLVMGVGACLFGLLGTEEFFANHFSSDGHITEVAYVYALRVVSGGTGTILLLLSLLCRIRTLQNLLLAISAIILCLGGLEVGLHIVTARSLVRSPDTPTGLRASMSPGLFYENTPNFYEDGELKFNSLGMRDDERVLSTDRPTIVVVGDSIEAWRAEPVAKMYPRHLESMLNARYGEGAVQVVNFGVTGYSLHQKLLMLKSRGLAWQPRLVIVGYCLNDPIPAWELINHFTNKPKRKMWRSLEFINARIRHLLLQHGLDFYTESHRLGGEAWSGLLQDFRDFGALADAYGFKVVLVIFPLMVDTTIEYPWVDIHRRVTEIAKQYRIDVIDLLNSYRGAGFSMVRADTVHPNAVGHRIAAEELYTVITEQHLLVPQQLREGIVEHNR